MRRRAPHSPPADGAKPRERRLGLARRLSKLGICSRTEAERRIKAGRVAVGGRIVVDPEFPTTDAGPTITLDGQALVAAKRVYLMLNKPRGLTTSTADEQGRETVYRCLDDPSLPWLAPVGRLDRASEGLLLFSNDPEWAAGISAGGGDVVKIYRVRIDRVADQPLVDALLQGVSDRGEQLRAVSARLLSESPGQQRWIEVELDEGRNRHIRRLLAALGVGVDRLIRVAVGSLDLGQLARGQWRLLSDAEVAELRGN